MLLKARIRIPWQNKSVFAYIQSLKSIADELAITHEKIKDDDLTLYALDGLGNEYKEIAATIRARNTPMTFKELHDKLVDYETFLTCSK